MRLERRLRLALMLGAALVIFASPLPAQAQNCALCYTQAAASGSNMLQALRSGILILILPPTFMSIGMIFVVYRKRNQFRQTVSTAESDPIWNRASVSSAAMTPCPPPAQ